MEQLKKQEEILSLGKTIIKQLKYKDKDRHDSPSILEEWMAQYIAELIKEIEICSDSIKKKDLEKECCNTILQLWDKRYSWPDEIKPLAGLKKIHEFIGIINDKSFINRFFGNNKKFKNPWDNIANKTINSSIDIVKLCFYASLLDSRLLDDKIWFDNHKDMLTKAEIENFSFLDFYINDEDMNTKFKNYTLNGDGGIEIDGTIEFKDRMSSIIKSMEENISGINLEIEKLKKR